MSLVDFFLFYGYIIFYGRSFDGDGDGREQFRCSPSLNYFRVIFGGHGGGMCGKQVVTSRCVGLRSRMLRGYFFVQFNYVNYVFAKIINLC